MTAARPAVSEHLSLHPGVDQDIVVRYPSFEDFYRTNRTNVGRALALTLRNPDLASDAVDEAMARAYQRWTHVGQLDNPGGWVYRVGLNWSRSVLRRLTRPAPIWVSANSASEGNTSDPSIDRALASLSTDQRAVVVCRLLLGLSEGQAATALGIRPGTVKSRLHRALDRLAPLLAPLTELEQ
jgi:RNA polymerase sigma factor (sigma-70 family)